MNNENNIYLICKLIIGLSILLIVIFKKRQMQNGTLFPQVTTQLKVTVDVCRCFICRNSLGTDIVMCHGIVTLIERNNITVRLHNQDFLIGVTRQRERPTEISKRFLCPDRFRLLYGYYDFFFLPVSPDRLLFY